MSVRAIVLAAGKGTRMKSRIPKVLHPVCGRPMLWYTLRELRAAGIDEIVVVTNDELQARIAEFDVRGIVQSEQLGTGHAVKIALDATPSRSGSQVVVAYGDMPLVPHEIFSRILAALDGGTPAAMSLVTVRMPRQPAVRRGTPRRSGAHRRSTRCSTARACNRRDECRDLRF